MCFVISVIVNDVIIIITIHVIIRRTMIKMALLQQKSSIRGAHVTTMVVVIIDHRRQRNANMTIRTMKRHARLPSSKPIPMNLVHRSNNKKGVFIYYFNSESNPLFASSASTVFTVRFTGPFAAYKRERLLFIDGAISY